MKRILFCVLNWGLGHATRSIPLIREFIAQGAQLELASDGLAHRYLMRTFPEITIHKLPGYNIRYKFKSLFPNLLQTAWRVQNAISAENRELKSIIERVAPHIILSDNRYGCHDKSCFNIIITHQFGVVGQGRFIRSISTQLIVSKLRPFNQILIPDFEPPNNLAGELSLLTDDRAKFIGPLSQLDFSNQAIDDDSVLFLLSGPEPSRTIFEKKIIHLIHERKIKGVLVRGYDGNYLPQLPNVKIINVAAANELSKIIQSAAVIVCRSGYSTIMDLIKLQRKAIFVPTPGQPEQQYLAVKMNKLGHGICISENKFNTPEFIRAREQLRLLTCTRVERTTTLGPLVSSILQT